MNHFSGSKYRSHISCIFLSQFSYCFFSPFSTWINFFYFLNKYGHPFIIFFFLYWFYIFHYSISC
ncbi:hypothetical protein KAR52_03435 [Candidatus Pacearchaeota archaeon]|nr:hypothetical protein [Candidatus Pacearchaeota archaeon]